MTVELEDRITHIEVGGKKLVAEVRQYEPGSHITVWVSELQRTIRLDDTKDASTSGKYANEDEGAICYYSYKTWKSSSKFVRISKNMRTSTN